MKEEVILMLSELRSQINDKLRVKKESSANDKGIVSMLMSVTLLMCTTYW